MSVYLNDHDFSRLIKLAGAIMETNDEKSSLNIYISPSEDANNAYVSLEIRGYVNHADVRQILADTKL